MQQMAQSMNQGTSNTAAQFFHPSQQTTGRGPQSQMGNSEMLGNQTSSSNNQNTSQEMIMMLSNQS